MNRLRAGWRRADVLLHRWIGILLGGLVFVWFGSGIAMMYYPYPAVTDARGLALLRPFEPDTGLIGFARAARAAGAPGQEAVGARLQAIAGRPVYQLRRARHGTLLPFALVDARTGTLLSPLDSSLAEAVARQAVGPGPRVVALDRMASGDHYMMSRENSAHFPAWRARFDDPASTAVYVGAQGGDPFGIVTRLTRFTTWTGTVPHWLYFQWLYRMADTWNAVIVVAASFTVLLGLTGLVWGVLHLLPLRRRNIALSPYHGVSRWHHLAGVIFGLLVVSWALSGVYQNLGAESSPTEDQVTAARGGPVRWDRLRLSEAEALSRARGVAGSTVSPLAVDLTQVAGHPGYEFHLAGKKRLWVDAEQGEVREALGEPELRDIVARMTGPAQRIAHLERISEPDDYYYARHGREVQLPVCRITLQDQEGTRLYLDPVSGVPVAWLTAAARRDRWLRDALHSLDFPALNNSRPLWDAVMLTLLLGGVIVSGTGVILLVRRLVRMAGGR